MEPEDTRTPSGKTVTDPRGQGQPQGDLPQAPGGGGAPGTGEQRAITPSEEARNQQANGQKSRAATDTPD